MGGLSVIVLMNILLFLYLFFITIFVAIILYTIISYTFEGISIMCMSKNMGYKNTFTAWIPFYNKYLLGSIAGNKIMGILSGVLSFVSICLGIYFYIHKELEIVLFIMLIISLIITFILDTIISHKIYISHTNKYGDVLTIFNILSFGLLRPIFLFIVRNGEEKINVRRKIKRSN